MKNRIVIFLSKHSKWFVGAVVIALFSVVGIPMMMRMYENRQKFDWSNINDDFGNKDSEGPFGAKYYIEHLSEMWQGRVECDSDLVSSLQKHKGQKCNYIVFSNDNNSCYDHAEEYDEDTDESVEQDSVVIDGLNYYKALIDAVGTGNNIVFCNSSGNDDHAMLQQTRFNKDFDIYYFTKDHSAEKTLVQYIDAKTDTHRDSAMVWKEMLNYYYNLQVSDSVFENQIFTYYKPYGYGCTVGVLVSPNNNYYVVARHFGEGCALLSGAPMLFSNYVMSVPDVQRVSDRLLHYTFDEKLPLVIIYTAKHKRSDNDDDAKPSIFEVMFKHPATKVAMYLLIIMLLLVVVFNSRRRRNVENAVKREENSSLSYIRHLATLYSAKSDYKELLEIEQRKILYQLRREYRFDIRTNAFTLPSEYAQFIADSKGGNVHDISMALTTLESLTSGHEKVNSKSYVACIKLLNDALYSLENK